MIQRYEIGTFRANQVIRLKEVVPVCSYCVQPAQTDIVNSCEDIFSYQPHSDELYVSLSKPILGIFSGKMV